MRSAVALLATAALLVAGGGAGLADSADAQPPAADGGFRYAAKAVCSLLGGFQDDTLADGVYRTAVSVLNPSDEEVTLVYRVSVARPAGVPPEELGEPLVSAPVEATLAPDEALTIDCGAMAGLFCPYQEIMCIDFAAIEGFVIVRSPVELDVVAAYSARTSRGEMRTLDVEPIAPR